MASVESPGARRLCLSAAGKPARLSLDSMCSVVLRFAEVFGLMVSSYEMFSY